MLLGPSSGSGATRTFVSDADEKNGWKRTHQLSQTENECQCKSGSRRERLSIPGSIEAAAELSVYMYLERRPFLNSREEFVAALDELATFPPPNLAEFDQKRFNEYRLTLIRRLRREFGKDDENSAPAEKAG